MRTPAGAPARPRRVGVINLGRRERGFVSTTRVMFVAILNIEGSGHGSACAPRAATGGSLSAARRPARRALRTTTGLHLRRQQPSRAPHPVDAHRRRHSPDRRPGLPPLPGDLIWYHEDEPTIGEVLEGPWSFYTVNFIAPTLPPPPFERRVRRAQPATHKHFDNLLAAWHETDRDPVVREMDVHSCMLAILAGIGGEVGLPFRMDAAARLWWEIEGEARRDLAQQITLRSMTEMSGRSAMTITRACHEAVGLPPLKRIKQIRMSLAAAWSDTPNYAWEKSPHASVTHAYTNSRATTADTSAQHRPHDRSTAE